MAAQQVSVREAVRYAWTLLLGHWREMWGALALCALGFVVLYAGEFSGDVRLAGGGLVLSAVIGVVVSGAVLRIALADRRADEAAFRNGHAGLQWRKLEWRLLAAYVLTNVFLGFCLLLGLVALGAVLIGVLQAKGVSITPGMRPEQLRAAAGDPAFLVLQGALVVLLLIILTLATRLALALPASADEGAVRVLRTWKLTRGRVLQIMAALILACLPVYTIGWVLASALIATSGGVGQAGPDVVLVASIILGVMVGALLTPLGTAVGAYFYRALVPTRPVPAVPPAPQS